MSEPTPDESKDDDRKRIYTEEAKQRQVSHWDLDYLPREEIDAAVEEGPAGPDSAEKTTDE